jgi:hypothetical protein
MHLRGRNDSLLQTRSGKISSNPIQPRVSAFNGGKVDRIFANKPGKWQTCALKSFLARLKEQKQNV